ncbi:beta-lactamase superfamily domain-containing protein [Tricharina praecox]|uniref:beta-lactamase superfamily domain-containing protein n=1 Tax=Tricharina praecox TaxID=43433 RepID=UPI0022205AB0|nr:beta-lactamase superfamily domain-containing protein [Tricharina praecox]KAI5846779.1 beta-lactamase superfamily domain-containing protein [Tricharina praecox]
MSTPKFRLALDPNSRVPPLRNLSHHAPSTLPPPKSLQSATPSSHNTATLTFIGTATTILEWSGLRVLTDPNFLHAGDHVHLGPGVTATRVTDPAVPLDKLPPVDVILLSHYHEDHFDRKVEEELHRDIPIVTTPHAHAHLAHKPDAESFTAVYPLDPFECGVIPILGGAGSNKPAIRVTAMPGKHVPPGPAHILDKVNDLLGAVPPTNGWMLELGHEYDAAWSCDYRIYISGDTLLVDELREIPERYKDQRIDLMLVHLGGTTIPGPNLPLLMVTMDAAQGIELMRLIHPEITIPIHYDDYDVFLSPLSDFKAAVTAAGLDEKVVYLDRGDAFGFEVKVGDALPGKRK